MRSCFRRNIVQPQTTYPLQGNDCDVEAPITDTAKPITEMRKLYRAVEVANDEEIEPEKDWSETLCSTINGVMTYYKKINDKYNKE